MTQPLGPAANAPSQTRAPAPSPSDIARAGWSRLMETPAITWGGFLGIGLGLFCLAVAVLRGPVIPPEGELHKAITFDIAVGIYLLTLAFLVPSAGLSEKGRRRWIAWSVGVFAYSYSLETIQTLRGLDPRFSRVASGPDQVLGAIFAFVAIGMIVLFVVLVKGFFRRGRSDAESPVLLAIRYGCAATVSAFAAGLWMSALQGRHTGAEGNILPLHALGFHGLQAIPLIALLLVWSGASGGETRRWVHITGVAWLAACAAVAWQTVVGRSVLEVSPATIASAFLLAAWGVVALFAFWRWARVVPSFRRRVSPDISRTPRGSRPA
ncbi:MAG TPA: hypothetical protein VNO75_03960 [Gemmatimonadaceae bacterium]|nr:hypothetical protein [Gemmatimonadaceae bacterium]